MGRDLQGLALKNIQAKILKGKKALYEEFGEMLFTHFGVSGPVLLSASSYGAAQLKKAADAFFRLKASAFGGTAGCQNSQAF